MAINQVVDNLRRMFGDKIADIPDDKLLEEYRDFGLSDMYGDNDRRFLEFLGLEDSE